MKGLTAFFSMFAFFPSICLAVPIHYNVTGDAFIYDFESNIMKDFTLSGEIYFDDVVYVSGPPIDWYSTTYSISSFSIDIGPYAFAGHGRIASHYYGDFTCPFDTFQLRGHGDWTIWESLNFGSTDFYYADGTIYDKGADPADFFSLPYRITSTAGVMAEGIAAPPMQLVSLTFTSSAPPPVPEPTTIVLFGIGLTGLAGVARRKRLDIQFSTIR